MHNYKLMEDNETMLVNTCFFDEEDCEYAFKRRFNIKYTEVRNTGFAADTMLLQNKGYKFELKTEPDVAPDGTKLEDKIYAYYTHPDNRREDEKTIVVEVLNYLICLSRLVSPNDAARHYGFEFDGAYIDLFRTIKNDFEHNMLTPNKISQILKNKVYKNVVEELDNLKSIINEWKV